MSEYVKVAWDKDEWYPVFDIQTPNDWSSDFVEVPRELLDRYERNLEEFGAIQEEIKSYVFRERSDGGAGE